MSDIERMALFIDGMNLYVTGKALGFTIDYRRLLDEFGAKGRLIRASYYQALSQEDEFSPLRPLVDWLDFNGYTVVSKPAKEIIDPNGHRRFKSCMSMELAVDALTLAKEIDHMVLFSGDGDFRPLVAAVQRKGARVSVVSTIRTQPAMIADELRRQADNFIDLFDLMDKISRDPDAGRTRLERGRRFAPPANTPA